MYKRQAAIKAESLGYEEKALAFTLEGLLNKLGSPPAIMFNAGFLDFDWPGADTFWRTQLEITKRSSFTNLTATLCGLPYPPTSRRPPLRRVPTRHLAGGPGACPRPQKKKKSLGEMAQDGAVCVHSWP